MLFVLRVENLYLSPSPLHTGIMIMTGAAIYGLMQIVLKDRFIIDNLKVGMKILHR